MGERVEALVSTDGSVGRNDVVYTVYRFAILPRVGDKICIIFKMTGARKVFRVVEVVHHVMENDETPLRPTIIVVPDADIER